MNPLFSATCESAGTFPGLKRVICSGEALPTELCREWERLTGAPLADEIVFILAMSTGPRVHARMAGLAANAISLWDGLR